MQSWSLAGGLIALCALADTFNGEFSGLFSRSENLKKFGNQFDSLADGLSFGLVPVVCLLQMSIFDSTAECVMWGAMAFFYIVCAITRLGDHSLHHEKKGRIRRDSYDSFWPYLVIGLSREAVTDRIWGYFFCAWYCNGIPNSLSEAQCSYNSCPIFLGDNTRGPACGKSYIANAI